MEPKSAILALAVLAHERRPALFRALVVAGPDGMSAGAIARTLDVPPSSLSHHLSLLEKAGLATVGRAGRSLIYVADFAAMQALIAFLTKDCCAGLAPAAACTTGDCV